MSLLVPTIPSNEIVLITLGCFFRAFLNKLRLGLFLMVTGKLFQRLQARWEKESRRKLLFGR